ncbi:hypothetical protein A2Z00_00715 [Candidatus Gottesmanbacteria bacterium RBG_13_45_10]|uniref:Major facilitator superfamily (MFS) profile domain-containing protein n=1 Tax=Candidatus Gottesmanbacteria bacterium RBG_13_45_10 TaxID=1798370 RepID=A0A1F5ZGQ9_9BACT|nr:MAG: hypothetical protein A2Z00_00715 [Candidatus Gottesmanbacteria bacterium RBG_13_45_10]
MKNTKILGFSSNVFFLSLVSFFNDIGGETIKRAIPLYLVNVLKVPASVIGLIEGVSDATPQLFQPISGYISDFAKKRKPIIIIGQLLRSIMILLYWSTTWPHVLLLRFLDRSGKGITGATRDALISVSSEKEHVGRSFGLSRALDNAGAVIGMVLASILIFELGKSTVLMTHPLFQRIVLLTVVPLFISLGILTFLVHDVRATIQRQSITLSHKLGTKYYLFLFFSFLFALGSSSDAFLILKAQMSGIALWQIFLLLAGYSLVASLSGYRLSSLSDRIGRKTLLVAGWTVYGVVYFFFARSTSPMILILLFLTYGLYYGFTEGSAKALVSDIVSEERRGTAYGIYNMVVGFTMLPASLIAGYLWQTFAPSTALYFGSAMALVATLGLFFIL